MKKIICLVAALFASTASVAATDHYYLRDGNHIHHMKVTTTGDDIHVSADVDFEANKGEENAHSCSADISGPAKSTGDKEITLKKQAEGKAHFCALKINLTDTGAKVEQTEGCTYFAAGICHFDSDGKELLKLK